MWTRQSQTVFVSLRYRVSSRPYIQYLIISLHIRNSCIQRNISFTKNNHMKHLHPHPQLYFRSLSNIHV